MFGRLLGIVIHLQLHLITFELGGLADADFVRDPEQVLVSLKEGGTVGLEIQHVFLQGEEGDWLVVARIIFVTGAVFLEPLLGGVIGRLLFQQCQLQPFLRLLLDDVLAHPEERDERVAQFQTAQLDREVEESVRKIAHVEAFGDHTSQVIHDAGAAAPAAPAASLGVDLGEDRALDPAQRGDHHVDVIATEAHGGFDEVIAEESRKVAVPRLHPGQDALAGRELPLELVDMGVHLFLIDDEGPSFRTQLEKTPAYLAFR